MLFTGDHFKCDLATSSFTAHARKEKKRMTLECLWTSVHMFKKNEKLRYLFSLAEQFGNFIIMGNRKSAEWGI